VSNKIELNCPCCNEKLLAEIVNGEIVLLPPFPPNKEEVDKLLKESNIEFG